MAEGHRSLLGRDLFPALGLSIQQANNQPTVNQLDQEYCSIKKQIATNFPDLISRTMPIRFQQTIFWMAPDGSTPKEVILKSKKPCVGHNGTQAAAIEIQTTRKRRSSFIRNSRTPIPEQKNHSMSSSHGNSLTKESETPTCWLI